jgi:competence ComEA-like helix-hairpin-helix protein
VLILFFLGGLIIRKLLMGFVLTFMLMPVVFANIEYKGTETVNINKANSETLAAYLKGVGANKAEAIVKYRRANGNFSSIEDLKNVPGIGDETFKDNKKYLSTSRGKSVAPEGYKMAGSSGKSTSTKKKTTAKKSTSKKSSSSDSSSSNTKKSTSAKKEKGKPTAAKKKSGTNLTAAKKSATEKKSTAKKASTEKKSTTKKKSSSKKTTTAKTTKNKPVKKNATKKKTTKKKSS